MNCTKCKEKLVELLEGLLPESQRRVVEEHLKDCQQCQAELEELKEVNERITADSETWQQTNLEDAVFNRIIVKQNEKLKQADRINRQFRIWRRIMNSKITKYSAAAVIIIAVFLTVSIFNKTIPTASAAQVLQEAINAVSDIWSVHMKTRMRTLPNDNFSVIGPEFDFVDIEMWKHTDENGLVQWRVEKPGRVLLMDGQNTTMLIRPNYGVLAEKPYPLGCYDSWSGRLLNVRDLLDNELKRAKDDPEREVSIWHEKVEGSDKLMLEVDVKAGVSRDSYLRNKFIMLSDHLKIYQFDPETKLLEAFQVYLHSDDGNDVLIFEVADIKYNQKIDNDVFTLDLPENMIWHGEPKKLPDNEKYVNMTPIEVVGTFFQSCADENWDEVIKFLPTSAIPEDFKNILGGLEIISLGEPFQSAPYPGWFIPYEIKLKTGQIRKHTISIRNDNPAKRFMVDGGL